MVRGIWEASDSAARVLPGRWGEPSSRGQLAGPGLTVGGCLLLGGAVVAFVASLAIASTHLLRSSAPGGPSPAEAPASPGR